MSCHIPTLPVQDPTYRSRTLLTDQEIAIDLSENAAMPRPARDAAGTFHVPVYSDFKRHYLGSFLSGVRGEHGIQRGYYMTRRLWGLYNTGPYLHDGSATLFDEAIAMHGGTGSEAMPAVNQFMSLSENDKASLRVYLISLARAPSIRVR